MPLFFGIFFQQIQEIDNSIPIAPFEENSYFLIKMPNLIRKIITKITNE